jgi:DNA modification methylase
LFNWRGQFTPDFVDYLLSHFARKGEFVVDPFSGSGTVLQEAALRGLQGSGFEINPSAYAMSKFFSFANLTREQRIDLSLGLERKLRSYLGEYGGERVYSHDPEYRVAYAGLLKVGASLFPELTKSEIILLLNALFLSERDKKLRLKESIEKSFSYVDKQLLALPYSPFSIEANLGDARQVGLKWTEEIDLILTSPPYINVFNYHQNYRAFVEIFDFDLLKVANSEFGSNRKNRGNRFKTVVQYCLDMEQALRSFWVALKPRAYLIIVLGRESNVRSVAFQNGRLVVDLLTEIGGFSRIDVLTREFVNKFGMSIKEDILIYERLDERPASLTAGRSTALHHLELGLARPLEGEIRSDLLQAIESMDSIQPSPLFDSRVVFKHAQDTA